MEAMSLLPRHAAPRALLTLVLVTLASASPVVSAGCKSFTVYTKNTQRAIVPNGTDGPLGDMVVANGLIYERPVNGIPSIGTFDLSAIITSVNGASERRRSTNPSRMS